MRLRRLEERPEGVPREGGGGEPRDGLDILAVRAAVPRRDAF